MEPRPYQQIIQELKQRIASGRYSTGEALPPRTELMREFGVARATLDRAIREMTDRGLLIGKHGSGTYVSGAGVNRRRVALIGNAELDDYANIPFDVIRIAGTAMNEQSARGRLFDYDGLLWMQPEATLLAVATAIGDRIPQVVINRVVPDLPFVSIDHRGAYYAITRQRLLDHPESSVIFLRSREAGMVVDYRFEGFADACREAGRFYEIFHMPLQYNHKLELLKERIHLDERHPVIAVADARAHTGAFMRFAAESGAVWRKHLWYHDFDNDFPVDVWGVTVTSFLQSAPTLFKEAARKLHRIFEGDAEALQGKLIAPEFHPGDT